MGQKRNRSSGNGNRNERNISNNREVSRRSKGRSRYAYEEEMRNSSRYYDDVDYDRREKKRRAASTKSNQEMRNSRRNHASYDHGKSKKEEKTRKKEERNQ